MERSTCLATVTRTEDWGDDRWADKRCNTMATTGMAGVCDNVPTVQVQKPGRGYTTTAYYCDLHVPEEYDT